MAAELLHILFGAERGGCETDSIVLIRELPEIRHRVLVLGPTGPMCEDWEEAGAEVHMHRLGFMGRHTIVAALRRFVDEHPPDAVMLWHGLIHLPQIIHALNPLGVPMGVHGGNPAHTMRCWNKWRYELLRHFYPRRGPRPTYICCSQYVADSFESTLYLSRFQRVVIPNGVTLPTCPLHQVRPYDASRWFVIGMVAQLNSIKDHATLLRAFAKVHEQFPNAKLELAGDGEERGRLKQLARTLNIVEAVDFLGDLADVYEAMDHWDLFAYATTEHEGMGNAVAEAMMLGLPCVVTDVGPTHEFAGDGTAVRLVRPADPDALAKAICDLIPDAAAHSALSATGRGHAESRYHPAAFARQYAEVLGLAKKVECSPIAS